ncbi:MAG: sortase [Microthrixaceae bacterium]
MLHRLMGGLGRLLIWCGAVLLLFVAYQLWGTGLDEQHHQTELAAAFSKTITRSLGVGISATPTEEGLAKRLAAVNPKTAPPLVAPAEGQPVGIIEIPKIGVRKAFVQGVAKADLRKGPGHYVGTPFPGNPGNAGIAGHRTTYGAPFNRIDELVPGDRVYTYTSQGRFVYEVMPSPPERRAGPENKNWGQGWFAVPPRDVSVLDQMGDNRLTLTACHPKYSARLRIIVQAELVAEPAAPPAETAGGGGESDPGQTVSEKPGNESSMISGDPGEKVPASLWGALVVAVWLAAIGVAALRRRGSHRGWPVYVGAAVLSAFPLWLCFVHLDRFLPAY